MKQTKVPWFIINSRVTTQVTRAEASIDARNAHVKEGTINAELSQEMPIWSRGWSHDLVGRSECGTRLVYVVRAGLLVKIATSEWFLRVAGGLLRPDRIDHKGTTACAATADIAANVARGQADAAARG
jgi:hypothetical protein